MLKKCNDESVKKLAEVADELLQRKEILESWRKKDLISSYKGRADVRSCENYKSVEPLEHGMKLIERIFEKRLRTW